MLDSTIHVTTETSSSLSVCPLKPLPPMPAEVFLHYFQYKDSDNVHRSSHWLQRPPKKLKARIIDAPEVPVWGWGIYIVLMPKATALCVLKTNRCGNLAIR